MIDDSAGNQRGEPNSSSGTKLPISATTYGRMVESIQNYLDPKNRKKLIGLSVCALVCCIGIYFATSDAECSVGYEGEDCIDIDECSSTNNTCYGNSGHGKCKNTPGSFECYCSEGFVKTEADCVDIDECENIACESNLHCMNNIGSYSCGCFDGFQLVSDSMTMKEVSFCVDIDECSEGLCPKNSECENGQGSYNCSCVDGFEGDSCKDIDECESTTRCHVNAKCQNTDGSYKCSCMVGYYGNGEACFRGSCIDIFCPDNQKCVSKTSDDCECKNGFELNNDADCVDIDECEQLTCNYNAECINTIGTYFCK